MALGHLTVTMTVLDLKLHQLLISTAWRSNPAKKKTHTAGTRTFSGYGDCPLAGEIHRKPFLHNLIHSQYDECHLHIYFRCNTVALTLNDSNM